MHPKYDGNFKKNVVEYMCKNHLSFTETAALFKIGSHSSISTWYSMYCKKGPQAFLENACNRNKSMNSKCKNKKVSKETSKDLIAENQRLRMEKEYLKKLNALVQERIKLENKKK